VKSPNSGGGLLGKIGKIIYQWGISIAILDYKILQKNMGLGWFWHGSFFSNPTAEFTATFPFSTKSGFFR